MFPLWEAGGILILQYCNHGHAAEHRHQLQQVSTNDCLIPICDPSRTNDILCHRWVPPGYMPQQSLSKQRLLKMTEVQVSQSLLGIPLIFSYIVGILDRSYRMIPL